MNFSWTDWRKSLRDFWQKLTRPQKTVTVAAPLLVATALITLIVWAGRPQYVPLFSKIDLTSAAAVRSKLVSLKIPYELQDGGGTILVPKAQAAEARLELASAGVPQGSKFSFDYLNQMQLGETDADRQLRYVLALQSELANTLKTLNGVEDASVHIVMPQPSLFEGKTQAATAAVTLKLAPGVTLSREQVRGVANLLAASVEGLKPGNVTIVDTNGQVLSDVLNEAASSAGLSNSQLRIQEAVQKRIQQSVQSMLDQALGSGNAVVRVNADLNFDQVKVTSDKYGAGALVSKQVTSEKSSGGTAGAAPGVNSNVPGYPAVGGGNTTTSGQSSSTENYQPDKTQTEQVVSPGAIKRLSISVMADSNKVTPTQLASIQGLVTSAAGLDPKRGDQIRVAAIPFDTTALNQAQAAMARAAQNRRLLRYAELGAGILLGIIFLLLLVRTRSKRKRLARTDALTGEGQPLAAAEAEGVLLAQQQAEEEARAKLQKRQAKSAIEIERQKIREAVELYTRNNADEAARLLKTWLSEEY
ncbi:Flagellar M-ring protein FliF [Acididesulfobacillus acetoxydans]|uniref:Flagellar M-ring protein n=1 Tax=Acididesulfobacillus acetoxydans TaxID=1561005 RepID=A0A8S0W5A5_9FIRM|nr:flagellar basal-body MS-ring/collar protein FliF [Acididesulfobacillus acetoxydans]CAA7602968.1 Flagellar M-ring protein FliF [Acididesulfobacillus acetoxydans]CEJ05850.1 Flagellar M-ring protein [Acididesulfobacillus acetoxydans]